MNNLIHEPLKSRWCTLQSKWHHCELIESKWCRESSLRFVFSCYCRVSSKGVRGGEGSPPNSLASPPKRGQDYIMCIIYSVSWVTKIH